MSRNREMAWILLRLILAKRTQTGTAQGASSGFSPSLGLRAAYDAPADWLPAQRAAVPAAAYHVFDWNTEERIAYTP